MKYSVLRIVNKLNLFLVCPSSGYLARQISFLLNNYIYKEGEEDPENAGLLIPRYRAVGRTALNGKVYPAVSRESEEDLVPVRSIVTKITGNRNVVTHDLLSNSKFNDFTDGAAVGISYATSATEQITQEALGLKHGGHERILDQSGYLKADKPCTFREEGIWMYLKVRGKELKYPKPENLVTFDKTSFEPGENICVAYNTSSPIYKLNSLINLMRAKGSTGQRYYEKDKVIVSDCYAYEDGIIRYTEDERFGIRVTIGSKEYEYNPACMYYFPDGAPVKKFDRICSGVVNMNHVSSELGSDIRSIYLIFRKQFYTLIDSKFASSGVVSSGALSEEMVEFIFSGLTSVTMDPKEAKIAAIDYQGTQASILNKSSFYTALSFGFSSRVVKRAVKGDIDLSGDIMTDTVLGLLLNNSLD